MPLLNFKLIYPVLMKQFVTALNPLNRISCNFVVIRTYDVDSPEFTINCFPRNYATFKDRNLSKIEYTTETICLHNSTENTSQISAKLCRKVYTMCTCANSEGIFS